MQLPPMQTARLPPLRGQTTCVQARSQLQPFSAVAGAPARPSSKSHTPRAALVPVVVGWAYELGDVARAAPGAESAAEAGEELELNLVVRTVPFPFPQHTSSLMQAEKDRPDLGIGCGNSSR